MSTPVSYNGVTYFVPAFNDGGYAQGAGNMSLYWIALATALPTTGGALTGPLALGANKITGLANGTAATDAATFSQISGTRILQIVSASTQTLVVSTSAVFVDTTLTATITPSSVASKILVFVSQNCQANGLGGINVCSLQLLRTVAIIAGPTASGYQGAVADQDMFSQFPLLILDSPATASPVTYKTQFARTAGTGQVAVNDAYALIPSTSYMTLIEIG
jgi:hypothetical protein